MHARLHGDETIRALSEPLLQAMSGIEGLTEVTMSVPGVFFFLVNGSWHRRSIEQMDRNRCERLVEAVSYFRT